MKNLIVTVPPMKSLIKTAPGFVKKGLADYKLDIVAKCGFGCHYCSSNAGNYLRINHKKFAESAQLQLGRTVKAKDEPSVMMIWPDVVGQLTSELEDLPIGFGAGKVLMFSMLTDGFSPMLVKEGITRKVLDLILKKTAFTIRVLTKNDVVGTPGWVEFFSANKDRFKIGLSTGSLDDSWSKKMELGTSSPSARIKAYAHLQAAGVTTFGMLCPVFPDQMEGETLDLLIDQICPEKLETIWVEPYNDRANWKVVQSSYPTGSHAYQWFEDVYANGNKTVWSSYATKLYTRLREKAQVEGWLNKLKYLLYEGAISQADASQFAGLHGVLLQSKPGENGLSQNPWMASLTVVEKIEAEEECSTKMITDIEVLTQENENPRIQKWVNIESIQTIDTTSFVDTKPPCGYDFTCKGWLGTFQQRTPAIFILVGLDNISDQNLSSRIFKRFSGDIKRNPHHQFLISRDQLKYVVNGKDTDVLLPKHLAVLDDLNNEDSQPDYDNPTLNANHTRIAKCAFPAPNFDLMKLKEYQWVILEQTDKSDNADISIITPIIQFCNEHHIPVWIHDGELRGKIIKSGERDEHSADLYFDLPCLAGIQLLSKSKSTKATASALLGSISGAQAKASVAELEVGYRLYKLDQAARENGKSVYWEEHFGVKNRRQFCSIVLDINQDLGAQYILAIRNIERVKPGVLERAFDGEGEPKLTLPHGYTRYRDLSKFISEMDIYQGSDEYGEFQSMVFDPDLSNAGLMKKLATKFSDPPKEEVDSIYPTEKHQSSHQETNISLDPATESRNVGKVLSPLEAIRLLDHLVLSIRPVVPVEHLDKFQSLISNIKNIIANDFGKQESLLSVEVEAVLTKNIDSDSIMEKLLDGES